MVDDIEKLDEYVRKNPNDPHGYIELARALRDAGNLSRGREVLDKLIKSSEGDGEALLLRAEMLAQQKDWIGAYRDLREARRAGVRPPWKFFLRVYYFQWLILANQGWRPEPISRYMSLVMCLFTGFLLIYMSFGVLSKGGIIGFVLVLLMGLGFIWAGLALGGISRWLMLLQDKLTPQWNVEGVRANIKQTNKKRGVR
jgi:hypothetical protein